MKILLIMLFILQSCSSHPIRSDVLEKIHKGDSSDSLNALLGYPDAFKSCDGIAECTWWIYKKRADICSFGIIGNKVEYISCENNPNYHSGGERAAKAFGAVLQGAGQGVQNKSKNNITCNSQCDNYGNCYTRCN